MTVPTGSQVVGGFCSHQPGKGFFVYKCCYLLKEDPLKRWTLGWGGWHQFDEMFLLSQLQLLFGLLQDKMTSQLDAAWKAIWNQKSHIINQIATCMHQSHVSLGFSFNFQIWAIHFFWIHHQTLPFQPIPTKKKRSSSTSRRKCQENPIFATYFHSFFGNLPKQTPWFSEPLPKNRFMLFGWEFFFSESRGKLRGVFLLESPWTRIMPFWCIGQLGLKDRIETWRVRSSDGKSTPEAQRGPPENGKSSKKCPIITWVFMGDHPQESLETRINNMGTLLGVHPIVPWIWAVLIWAVLRSWWGNEWAALDDDFPY